MTPQNEAKRALVRQYEQEAYGHWNAANDLVVRGELDSPQYAELKNAGDDAFQRARDVEAGVNETGEKVEIGARRIGSTLIGSLFLGIFDAAGDRATDKFWKWGTSEDKLEEETRARRASHGKPYNPPKRDKKFSRWRKAVFEDKRDSWQRAAQTP